MRLRRADMTDAWILYILRTDPKSAKNYRNPPPKHWDEHLIWLSSKMGDKKSRIYILESGPNKIGMIRFDDNGEAQRISIAMDTQFRNSGIGRKMLAKGMQNLDEAKVFEAEIKDGNEASVKLFQSMGFVYHKDMGDGFGLYRMERGNDGDEPPQAA